jgi:1,4-dihydroxy-2-naphthoyl-CoA hydrolase
VDSLTDIRMRGFDALYGLRLIEFEDGVARGEVVVRDELKQPNGPVHGGVYVSLAESLCSLATALAVESEGRQATSQANTTNFLRPVTAGKIHATARARHRGRTGWVWDVDFSDDAGRLCALTRMTVAVRDR